MALLFWDASALVKRYYPEIGSHSVDRLIVDRSAHSMVSTPWGYAETYSILLRRFNGGVIDLATFTGAVSALQTEVVQNPDFGLLTITDAHVFSSIETMRRHNLNATDAVLLTLLVEFSRSPGAPSCVLIASDHRFLRAAASVGLPTLNPETLVPADVPSLLAAL
jgi:hypothetical protein